MIRSISIHQFRLFILLLVLVFLIGITLSGSYLQYSDTLVLGITLDFCITIPVLYFFAIRKTAIPKITVLSVFIICLIFASYLIPQSDQKLLDQIKFFAIPLVEIGIISFVIIMARNVIKEMKSINRDLEWYDAVRLACDQVFPNRIGTVLATEISVFYYSFFAWSKLVINTNEYTYFKKNGIKSVIGVFMFVILIETVAVHLLVGTWSQKVAWILTILSAYTCLQVWALIKSMDKRLIYIDHENKLLQLRYGFFTQTKIPFSDIHGIEANRKTLPDDGSIIQFSPLGMLDTHNIILSLTNTHELEKLYGFKKQYDKLAIYIDEKERFVAEVKDIITSDEE